MITEKKLGIWLPVFLAAGTLATMIFLDRRRNRAPIFEIDKVVCGENSYLTVRGCKKCPKWAISGKSYGRAITPACTPNEPYPKSKSCPKGQTYTKSIYWNGGSFEGCATPKEIENYTTLSLIS